MISYKDVPAAQIGEELEVFEDGGQFRFKIKGSNPPQARQLVVDRDIDIQLADGRKMSMISDHPGLMLEEKEYCQFNTSQVNFIDVVVPGVSFKILS